MDKKLKKHIQPVDELIKPINRVTRVNISNI